MKVSTFSTVSAGFCLRPWYLSGTHSTPPDSAVVPPNTGSFSSTATCRPRLRAVIAAARPAAPEPTTIRSYSVWRDIYFSPKHASSRAIEAGPWHHVHQHVGHSAVDQQFCAIDIGRARARQEQRDIRNVLRLTDTSVGGHGRPFGLEAGFFVELGRQRCADHPRADGVAAHAIRPPFHGHLA